MIINAPDSVASLAELDREQLATALDVWRERMLHHHAAACVHLIVNEGRQAGASLPHTHAQLFALDFVPAQIARERERAGAYATRTMGQSLVADLLQEEVRRRERIVAIDDEAVLIAPYASQLAYQLMLVPRRPRPRFEADGPTGAGLLHEGSADFRGASAPVRPSTSGSAPLPAAPTTSAGGSTSSPAWRRSPGSSSAPGSASTRSPPSGRPPTCATPERGPPGPRAG